MTPILAFGQTTRAEAIENKLNQFVSEVNAEEILEVDGVLYKGDIHKGVPVEEDSIKVLHHIKKTAYLVSVKSVLEGNRNVIIEAIESGEFNKVYGVTRIVGYYSRTSNWNKSKLGELKDRHKGNYSVGVYNEKANTSTSV